MKPIKYFFAQAMLSGAMLLSVSAHAEKGLSNASALSALSALPVASAVTAAGTVLSAGLVLTVASVQVVADGTEWVLTRASDGARVSIKISAKTAQASAVVVGTTVTVLALGSGWLLSTASEVIAYVPKEIGASLLYSEQLTK